MKRLGIRTRMTLWYISMLTIFLSLGVAGSYSATRMIIWQLNAEGMQNAVQMLVHRVRLEDDRLYFALRGEGPNRMPSEVVYALYDLHDNWMDGMEQPWIDQYPFAERLEGITYQGEKWLLLDRLVYINGQLAGRVRIMHSQANNTKLLTGMKHRSFMIVIPSILLAALGGMIISRRALKPIRKITRTAREIGAGDLSQRIEYNGSRDEVGELLLAFNQMADNLERSFEREKQFTSDASHEMRTPVAVILAHAEDALATDMPETYRHAMSVILEKGRLMQQMLTQLLMLARGYEQAEVMELGLLDLNAVISDIVEETADRAAEKGMVIETELEVGLAVRADLMLFTRMLINLLDNAVRYGKPNGLIKVSVKREIERQVAVITVYDNGDGIAPEHLAHIFERFYRVDKVRTAGSGSGLGLSFVDLIVQLHKGGITVESKVGESSCFTIELPL